ncbi:MAG: PQQ-binding-like beta-propeller repeat protein [Vicinamibacterales bacterium]
MARTRYTTGMRTSHASVAALLLASAITLHAADQQWPQFRGPQSSGVAADDPRLPETWSATENVRWKADIPGIGWSSPVVWGDHVFLTTAIATTPAPVKARVYGAGEVAKTSPPQRWVVVDVDLKSGKIRWQREVGAAVPAQPLHLKNSFASETPVTDGERVYAYFANAGLFVFDTKGKSVWSRPMPAPRMRSGWGAAASPVLHGGRIYLVSDNEDQSFLLALDAKSGKEVWKADRETGSSWVTPFIWTNPLRTEIVTIGWKKIRSYGLDGTPLWEMSGISTLSIPTPVAANGLLYLSSGYRNDPQKPVYAVKPGASGDISLKAGETSNAFVAWSNSTLASYNPSALVYRGTYYTLYDTAFLAANDATTGREVYGKQRVSADSTGFTASPWAYNGKVFALSEDGDTFVMDAGPAFKLVGRNGLDEMTLATPAIAKGTLLIRTASKLYRIGKK